MLNDLMTMLYGFGYMGLCVVVALVVVWFAVWRGWD